MSVPKPFTSCNVSEGLKICRKANKWMDEIKALKFSTILEREALAVWLEIPEIEQEEYEVVQE